MWIPAFFLEGPEAHAARGRDFRLLISNIRLPTSNIIHHPSSIIHRPSPSRFRKKFGLTVKRLWQNKPYRYGVVAQFFYVGVQIMCWTFIIQYGTRVFMNEGMTEQAAEVLSQRYNIVAMAIFCVSRFICTFLLKYIQPSKLLTYLGILGAVLILCVVFIDGRSGIYCLVAVSACMSLMFPTIYGIALTDTGDDAKIGAAGLIMAILGGSVLPPLQARIIDGSGLGSIASVNLSFVLPLICFIVIILYGKYITKHYNLFQNAQ